MISAELLSITDAFIPGKIIFDTPFIPVDQLRQIFFESLHNPIDMFPLAELAFPSLQVIIILPD